MNLKFDNPITTFERPSSGLLIGPNKESLEKINMEEISEKVSLIDYVKQIYWRIGGKPFFSWPRPINYTKKNHWMYSEERKYMVKEGNRRVSLWIMSLISWSNFFHELPRNQLRYVPASCWGRGGGRTFFVRNSC